MAVLMSLIGALVLIALVALGVTYIAKNVRITTNQPPKGEQNVGEGEK